MPTPRIQPYYADPAWGQAVANLAAAMLPSAAETMHSGRRLPIPSNAGSNCRTRWQAGKSWPT
mgnify:CR=1 FL=1